MSTQIEALANDPEIRPLLVEQRRQIQPDGTEMVTEAPKSYMRATLRKEREAEAEELEGVLRDPFARKRITNPDVLKRRVQATRRDIVTQTPPETTPRQRDKLFTLMRACEPFIRDGMPTAEQMRRNPPGIADQHRRWDKLKKPAVLLWKTARLILDPHNDEKDYRNVEILRRQGMSQNLDVNAQIPGVFGLSNEAKANYDGINWTDPVFQAQAIAQLQAAGVKINLGVHRGALRAPGNYPVFETPDGQGGIKTFTGPFGQANYKRYLARQERMKREEGAVA